MKAAVVSQFAAFDTVQVTDVAEPRPGANEVLVAVEASDINFPDLLYIEGKYQAVPELPFSPGLGAVGTIAGLGAQVGDRRLGERVLVLPDHGCHAEKLTAPADWCFTVPDAMPATVAAALGLVYQTAWFALMERGRMAAGDNVLVLGTSGGVGTAAIQLAKALGAGQVIAATRGAEGIAHAKAIGADHVIDTAVDDPAAALRSGVHAVTGGNGADVVIDPVGGALGQSAIRAMAWGGRLVVVGFASGEVPIFKGNYLLVKNISVSGLQWTDYRNRRIGQVRDAQAAIFELWAQGRLEPRVSRILPLDGIVEALTQVKQGRARGKIILTTTAVGDQPGHNT